MSVPRSELLRNHDLRAAFEFVGAMVDALDEPDGFAQRGVQALPHLVPSELTTLSICDLSNGRRKVTGVGAGAIGAQERAAFDRHFREHPLVRYHADEHGTHAHRISDSIAPARFRETALYNDYYRRVGVDHAVALPVYVDNRWLVSFVLNRQGCDFSDRELALLDQVRTTVAKLFRRTRLLELARDAHDGRRVEPPALAPGLPLSEREREVLRWVAAGKTDRDVADILAISHRTVHKHLQRVYAKLGVETRTAAVMRALAPP